MLSPSHRSAREEGFSLIELLVVVAIIAIMAATALPAIGAYFRNYQIKGAQSQVAGEIQTARSRAIMRNVNTGVSFVIVDQNSYRWIIEDPPVVMGPLRELPPGVVFQPAAATPGQGFRFSRLGAWCDPAIAACGPLPAVVCTPAEDAAKCQ